MPTFIEEMEALAGDFLTSAFFTTATITRQGVSAFDPISGSVTGSNSSIPCRAVTGSVMAKNADGSLTEKTQITANVELINGDILTIGALDYTVDETTTVAPHGKAFLWKAVAK